jgi:hypothetical protein
MTVLAELRAEVYKTWQSSPTQTVLWLDPQREWERLLDQLATELELIKYEGSQLELRVKIELESAQRPRIVYVPLPRQALSVLKEYEFALPVWDEGLLPLCNVGASGLSATRRRLSCHCCPVWPRAGLRDRRIIGVI